MNKLSNSMERLGMYQPTESPSTITEKKDLQLKKKKTRQTQASGTPQHYCHDQENLQGNTVKHGMTYYWMDQ